MISIKMRAEKDKKHISGAEKIIDENDLEKNVLKLIDRARFHEKGEPNFINIKIEKIRESEILYIPILNIKSKKVLFMEEGHILAKEGFNMREASAHVTMNTDGTFTIDIAGQDMPISGGDEKSRGSGIYKISSINIQGKGTFYGDTSADPSSGVVEYSISDIDPASIKQSSIFKESELSGTEYCDLCKRNEKKYEYTSHQFKIVDPEGKYSRSYTLNFVYRKDSEKETFSVGFWAHLTGVEKEEYVSHSGEDMGKTQKNTKDVDRELRIDFMGEIAK